MIRAAALGVAAVLWLVPALGEASCPVGGTLDIMNPTGTKVVGNVPVAGSGTVADGAFVAIQAAPGPGGSGGYFQFHCNGGKLTYIQRLIAPPNPQEMRVMAGGRLARPGEAPAAAPAASPAVVAAPAAAPPPDSLRIQCAPGDVRPFELKYARSRVVILDVLKQQRITLPLYRVQELVPPSTFGTQKGGIQVKTSQASRAKQGPKPLLAHVHEHVCAAAPGRTVSAKVYAALLDRVGVFLHEAKQKRCRTRKKKPSVPCAKLQRRPAINPGGVRN